MMSSLQRFFDPNSTTAWQVIPHIEHMILHCDRDGDAVALQGVGPQQLRSPFAKGVPNSCKGQASVLLSTSDALPRCAWHGHRPSRS